MSTYETALIMCTGITFVSALIAGGFVVCAANVWMRNKREERAAREGRYVTRDSLEREKWVELLCEKDAELESVRNEVEKLTKLYEFSARLLDESEKRRLDRNAEV